MLTATFLPAGILTLPDTCAIDDSSFPIEMKVTALFVWMRRFVATAFPLTLSLSRKGRGNPRTASSYKCKPLYLLLGIGLPLPLLSCSVKYLVYCLPLVQPPSNFYIIRRLTVKHGKES